MAKQMNNSDYKPNHNEIARRAEAIFEQSGRVPGRDMQNWLQAEQQLIAAHKGNGASRQNGKAQGKAAPVAGRGVQVPATR